MIYDVDITIPANTTEANAIKTDIKVTFGVVHQFDIVFPAGCAGLVYTRLQDGAHPVVPSTAGMNLSGDGIQITGKEFYEIETAPTVLSVYSWNDDDTYAHTITWRIYILPKDVLLPVAATEGFLGALKSLFIRRRTYT